MVRNLGLICMLWPGRFILIESVHLYEVKRIHLCKRLIFLWTKCHLYFPWIIPKIDLPSKYQHHIYNPLHGSKHFLEFPYDPWIIQIVFIKNIEIAWNCISKCIHWNISKIWVFLKARHGSPKWQKFQPKVPEHGGEYSLWSLFWFSM